MKLYGITKENKFSEFVEIEFQSEHREELLEEWLENNPDDIIESGELLIIGRQVTTNLGSFIDLLAIDRQGNSVVIELKRNKTPRETIAQALEFASFAEKLDYEQMEELMRSYSSDESINLAQYHREYFELASEEASVFNGDQRIVIVGQEITPEIRQTSLFLQRKGIKVTCLEFGYFQADDGQRLLSTDIVVGKEPSSVGRISTGSKPKISKKDFLESLDTFGKPVFERIIEYAEKQALPIHWGTKGFSLNVDIDGTHIAICYGYPPDALYKQSIYTALRGRGGLLLKLEAAEELADELISSAQSTGLFQPVGHDLKCTVDRGFSSEETEEIVNWIGESARRIQEFDIDN